MDVTIPLSSFSMLIKYANCFKINLAEKVSLPQNKNLVQIILNPVQKHKELEVKIGVNDV